VRRLRDNSDGLFRSVARSQGAVETHARGKSDDATSLLKVLRAASEKAKREFLATDRGIVAVFDCLLTVRLVLRRLGAFFARSYADVVREHTARVGVDRFTSLDADAEGTLVSIAGAQASNRSMEHSSTWIYDKSSGRFCRFRRDGRGSRA